MQNNSMTSWKTVLFMVSAWEPDISPLLAYKHTCLIILILCSTLFTSKGFWQWCITLRITGFLDFSHCPIF
jgi:hypothetical protein